MKLNPVDFWLCGLFVGFHLYEKLSKFWKRVWTVICILSLLPVVGYVAYMARNVGSAKVAMTSPPMQVTHVNIPRGANIPLKTPWRELKRLRLEEAQRDLAEITHARQQVEDITKKMKRLDDAQEEMVDISYRFSDGSTFHLAQVTHNPSSKQKVGTRKGPFCHITCMVHHGDQFDVETEPVFCKANWIPPKAEAIGGWWPKVTADVGYDADYEYFEPWPGPATAGFDSYKLYWKNGKKR